MTERKEDQELLIAETRGLRWRPTVSCFDGNASQPVPHPKGEPACFARCAALALKPWMRFVLRATSPPTFAAA